MESGQLVLVKYECSLDDFLINDIFAYIGLDTSFLYHISTVPHSDTCGVATHSLNIGAGSR